MIVVVMLCVSYMLGLRRCVEVVICVVGVVVFILDILDMVFMLFILIIELVLLFELVVFVGMIRSENMRWNVSCDFVMVSVRCMSDGCRLMMSVLSVLVKMMVMLRLSVFGW